MAPKSLRALASVERGQDRLEDRFYTALEEFQMTCRRAGSWRCGNRALGDDVFNCFVCTIPRTHGRHLDNLREAALTLQQGGGMRYDFLQPSVPRGPRCNMAWRPMPLAAVVH